MLTATILGPGHSTADLYFAQHGHSNPSSSSRLPFTPSAASHSQSIERDAPDTLTWADSTAIWTKGARAFRKYSYPSSEPILRAVFATFRLKEPILSHVHHARPSETFGPFHSPTSAKWGAPRVSSPQSASTPTSSEAASGDALESAVVIFLRTVAHVYMASGQSFIVHLPFEVDGAWALPEGGVLVQRALNKRESTEQSNGHHLLRELDNSFLSAPELAHAEASSRVWTLEHPLDVFKPVVCGAADEGVRECEEVGADTDLIESFPNSGLVVLYSRRSRRVTFARRRRIPCETVEPARPELTPDELLTEHPLSRRLSHHPRRSVGPKGLVAAHEKDLKDVTMMMGLESQEADRSEVVLDVIYEWKAPSGFSPSSAFISDDLSPSALSLNIHSTKLGQLFTFAASMSGSTWTISPPAAVAAISAIPAFSTRALVTDTIILSPTSALHIRASGRSFSLCIPHSDKEREDVSSKFSASLRMVADADGPTSMHSRPAAESLARLEPRVGTEFVAVSLGGERLLCEARFFPSEGLARQSLDALSFALPPDDFHVLHQTVLARVSGAQGTWIKAVIEAVRDVFGLAQPGGTERQVLVRRAIDAEDSVLRRLAEKHKVPPSTPVDHHASEPQIDTHLLPTALLALHLVAQDCRLDQTRGTDRQTIVPLILDIATAIGRPDWVDYWMRIQPGAVSQTRVYALDQSRCHALETPPDILHYLARRLTRPLVPFPAMQPKGDSMFGAAMPCRQTAQIVHIYDLLAYDPRSPASVVSRGYAAIKYMLAEKLSADWVRTLPVPVAVPLLEVIRACRLAPLYGWTPEVYDFIDRQDLALQASDVVLAINSKNTSEDDSVPQPYSRFSDRRLVEVERIMQTTRVRCIEFRSPKGASEADIAAHNQKMTDTIAQRTLSITVGQGTFLLGSTDIDVTRTCEVKPIELSIKLSPPAANTTLKALITNDHVDWPCFHNGVATALAISPSSKGIDSSWILSNKPDALNPEHGGFLLGLGLRGHLRDLRNHHAFPYLEARHDFTSVGLLLGLAASYAGSGDENVTKALSVHTHAHLPLGSQELNASVVVQAAAMIGLGLVHAGSRRVQTAKVALLDVGRMTLGGTEQFTEHREAYSFACAVSFGLIMLRRGGDAASEVDRVMITRLRRCINGHAEGPEIIDRNVASPGATLALGLMYLKSMRVDIRDMLEIPQTAQAMDHIPPEFLLFRTFARGLIMWDEVEPNAEWIEAQIPPFVKKEMTGTPIGLVSHFAAMYFAHIVAGACLVMGIKYAGTATESAALAIRHHYDMLGRLSASADRSYEGGIRRSAARQGLNVVSIAMCAVMSGTGEVGFLRRLRIAHGQEGTGVNYGTHMAGHMAVGLLCMGRCQYTLGKSDLAIAAMSIAFWPRFEPTPCENRAYPQMFRHLWALAAEPRCLQARDVDSGTVEHVPIKLVLRSAEGKIREQKLMSPTLVSPFDDVVSVELDTMRYWPIKYDFGTPAHRAALIRSCTIHVKRRAAYLDYSADNRGNRSLHARGGNVTGFDMHDDLLSVVAPPAPPAEEVLALMRLHTSDKAMQGYAEVYAGDDAEARFIRTVLLECLAMDKPEMMGVYHALWLGRAAAREAGVDGLSARATGEAFRAAQQLVAFYRNYSAAYSEPAPGERVVSLVRPPFLAALVNEVVPPEAEPSAAAKRAYLVEGRWSAGLGEWIARAGVPEWGVLVQLRERVEGVRSRWEEMGVGGVCARAVESVRKAERAREALLAQRWDVDVGAGEGRKGGLGLGEPAWKVRGVEEAVRAWMGAEGDE